MATKKVEVILEFDSKGAVTKIKDTEGKFIAMSKGADKAASSVKRLSIGIGQIALAAASIISIREAFQLVSESVELAGIQQIAERKLEQALLNTGDASEESAAQLKALASEVQNFSNFGDEAIITAQALLLSFGEVGGAQGAAILTPRLADVAAGIQSVTGEATDLNTVAQAVGRALTQGAGALTRYGVSMTEAQKAQFNAAEGMERVRLLSEILDSNFRGLAAATADPFVQAQNAIGDLKEALGQELRPELENTARQFTQFVQDERTIRFAESVGNALVKMGQEVIRFFQFGIPIAFNKFLSGLNDTVIASEVAVGNFIGALLRTENPFLSHIKQGLEAKKAIDSHTEALLNEELQLSANRIQAEMMADANRDLAESVLELNEAESNRSFATPGLSPLQARATQEQELTAITHDAIASRMDAQLAELNEAERLNNLMLLLAEKRKQAELEQMAVSEMAAASNVKTAADAANHLRGTIQQIIQMHVAEAVAASIPKVGWPLNLLLAPLAAIATNALFNNLVPAFADGVTGFGGGVALVGERGPELVTMGQGSNVITNENTQRILSRFDSMGAGSPNVSVNNSGVAEALSKLGDRIEGMQVQIDYFSLGDGIERHNRHQNAIGNG